MSKGLFVAVIPLILFFSCIIQQCANYTNNLEKSSRALATSKSFSLGSREAHPRLHCMAVNPICRISDIFCDTGKRMRIAMQNAVT
ncbi:hypothetical protein POVCU1_026330 [Plasmodium ovale curtisi]|uniref:PIR Superfamily Protein n=1 Tax=Plasmodium ovale curtisi TaxID=864141 RepID=A0A1A8WL69_PLAOA|nr:hypothetical protein POVCU1_026330 [Plasmodium ovale curtisi]